MEDNLITFFRDLIRQSGSYDIAISDFRRMIDDDDDLRSEYAEWCEANGYSERDGFAIFCDDCINNENSAMDSLNEYGEEWQ